MMRTRRLILLALLGLMALAAAGCRSGGSYPLEVFTEMHYQQAPRIQHPGRMEPGVGAVPITGRGATSAVTFDEAAQLFKSPFPGSAQAADAGKRLFQVNCAQCHGANADGQSAVADRLRTARQALPPAFNIDRIRQRAEGQLFWALTFGYPPGPDGMPAADVKARNMPSFEDLLTTEQRWQLVEYIKSIRGQ